MSESKGLVIIFTGNGKGKTTASLGMALRAWGQGMKVLVIQFIKGGWVYGELLASKKLEGLEMRPMGEGFVKDAGEDKAAAHRAAAQKALEETRKEIVSGKWDLLILDEIIYAVGFKLLREEDLLELIALKPPAMHLVMTGRNAPESIVDKADLVTEMKEIKHPYRLGIKAQKGVEY
ncbi:MAG: cob(I)yrinic acid a c-diamide adenosyltransferase [Peptococcaceae bacterium BICA1-7]|nr:MAG: cob(I)yrinic acid a c-diamide adenosyltransferase [Peptococcaceae bacterium BICA1-7]HBV99240.1 cob(I)yrinic acid a,c-diamide adenosyltransferase [Desulfotomaculum sp.]